MSAVIPLYDEGKRPQVKRCLFGMPNRQNLKNALSVQEMRLNAENEDTKRFEERWGFDVKNDAPVEGGLFECISVSAESVPGFYSRGYARRKTKSVSRVRPHSRSQSPIAMSALNNSTCARPSVKRRLPLFNFEDPVNDENRIESNTVTVIERVQVPIIAVPSPSSCSSSSSPLSDAPSPRSLQEHTPKPRVQTLVKDFFPLHKKQRLSAKSDSDRQT